MRRYLIDHARGRPNAELVALEGIENLLRFERQIGFGRYHRPAFGAARGNKPEWCTLVEVKYFLGLTDEEAAETLGLKIRTMQRMWRDTRKWLFEQMESGNAPSSAG